MVPKKPPAKKTGSAKIILVGSTEHFVYQGKQEDVIMNRHHLTLILEKQRKCSSVPSYGDIWPWLLIFCALLLALIPADFKDLWGIPAETWLAITIILILLSGGMALFVFVRALMHRKRRARTAEQDVQEIIDQMEPGRET